MTYKELMEEFEKAKAKGPEPDMVIAKDLETAEFMQAEYERLKTEDAEKSE